MLILNCSQNLQHPKIKGYTRSYYVNLNYNLLHNKVPHYIATFLTNTSIAVNRYLIRHAKLQPPLYVHE